MSSFRSRILSVRSFLHTRIVASLPRNCICRHRISCFIIIRQILLIRTSAPPSISAREPCVLHLLHHRSPPRFRIRITIRSRHPFLAKVTTIISVTSSSRRLLARHHHRDHLVLRRARIPTAVAPIYIHQPAIRLTLRHFYRRHSGDKLIHIKRRRYATRRCPVTSRQITTVINKPRLTRIRIRHFDRRCCIWVIRAHTIVRNQSHVRRLPHINRRHHRIIRITNPQRTIIIHCSLSRLLTRPLHRANVLPSSAFVQALLLVTIIFTLRHHTRRQHHRYTRHRC